MRFGTQFLSEYLLYSYRMSKNKLTFVLFPVLMHIMEEKWLNKPFLFKYASEIASPFIDLHLEGLTLWQWRISHSNIVHNIGGMIKNTFIGWDVHRIAINTALLHPLKCFNLYFVDINALARRGSLLQITACKAGSRPQSFRALLTGK